MPECGWTVSEEDAKKLTRKAVVYIAGPMTGIEHKNRPAFYSAEEYLQSCGLLVLNPARLPDGMPGERYMPICLELVKQADILARLPGWDSSPGATCENYFALYQGKRTVDLIRGDGNA